MSEETIRNELLHAVKLDFKQRGELAELAFMRKAAAMGFAVAKPWGESDRYDAIVRIGKIFWRVQVKSVWGKSLARPHYRLTVSSGNGRPYYADEIDFLVAYIFPEDTWYVFPVAVIEGRKFIFVSPGHKRSRYEPYRDAWSLMGDTATAEPAAEAASGA
jgi:hypothetical protein